MQEGATSGRRASISSPHTRAAFLNQLSEVQAGSLDVPDGRWILHQSALGCAVLASVSRPNAPAAGVATVANVSIPIVGLFRWNVGRRTELVDASTVLFVEPDQEYSEMHPLPATGHAAAIVAPSPLLMEQVKASCVQSSNPFDQVTLIASPKSQLIAHRLARLSPAMAGVAGDELLISFISEFFHARPVRINKGTTTLAQKAKEYVQSLHSARLSLSAAADELGVTPVYLTQAFKAAEGVPFYRYYLNLRLSEALGQLPETESITRLALELGFSSHSHFSAAFQNRYGVTPSEYRNSVKDGVLRSPPLLSIRA